MALYYEVRNYLLEPDKHICRLTFNDQPLARTWRLGKLQYTLDSTKIDQEANQPAQNHFEEEFMSDEYNVFDEFVGGLEQIDYLTDYMNYGISSQLVVFDDEKGKTKTIARKDYTFDDFDKDEEIFTTQIMIRTMNTLLISYMLRNLKLIHTQVK